MVAERFGVTSHQAPTRWYGGIHDVDLRCAFSQCLLKRPRGFDFLDNFRGQGLVFKEILKRPYSGFCENGRIWSIMIYIYNHIIYIYYTLDHLPME